MKRVPPSPKDIARFWNKVNKTSQCWLWTGATGQGYGRFLFQNVNWVASRMAWLITHGEIPDGLWVLHKCDNRPCVNPDHLYLGTLHENIRDMLQRKRHRNGSHIWHGSNCTFSKLTESDVIKIRSISEQTQREIAKQYGVSRSLISLIRRHRIWKNLA